MAVLMDDNIHRWGIFNCHVWLPGGKCVSSGSGRAGARALSCWSASLHFAPTFSFLTKTCTLISTCRIVFCQFWLPYIICPWVVFAWLGQRWERKSWSVSLNGRRNVSKTKPSMGGLQVFPFQVSLRGRFTRVFYQESFTQERPTR